MLIGMVGLIGSGKGTVGDYLVDKHQFSQDSFAKTLKDCLAIIFDWPRHLLEGDTVESRNWREQPDYWWSGRLGIKNFSPRMAMQLVGTEALRDHFHSEIWVATVERRIIKNLGTPTVLVDARFPDELNLIRRYGGKIVRVQKGPDPEWFTVAAGANAGDLNDQIEMDNKYSHIHRSETAWVGCPIDYLITNDADKATLYHKIEETLCQI